MHAGIARAESTERRRIHVEGAVQGVGFRPFVYHLAAEHGLAGWVCNTASGVVIEIQGDADALDAFASRLQSDKPSIAHILLFESAPVPVEHGLCRGDFSIRESAQGARKATMLPDLATCATCLRELFDPSDRRFRYPFINCTHCGPRFTIIESLPYDRPNTTMRHFAMCPDCHAEYEDPHDRRYHAQPNACPVCGPHLELWNTRGDTLGVREDAIRETVRWLDAGRIVAVKGLGGFHIMVDAERAEAVHRLRHRKQRDEKPFAVMFPDIASIEAVCHLSDTERRLLGSPQAPIMLLDRRADVTGTHARIAALAAPQTPSLGVLLPYTPLHHLLMHELGRPVVATSANLAEEPICTDEHEALHRLGNIVDALLVHNRPIARHADDSLVRVAAGRELILRRARGLAPMPIRMNAEMAPILAVGGHLKNTVAVSVGCNVFSSQHIGDLESTQSYEAFGRVIEDFERLYDIIPAFVARDQHPDYASTRFARRRTPNSVPIQHHVAHVVACLADNNRLEEPCIGLAWDGTGYGPDGTVWGGECFRIADGHVQRIASMRPFRLPGGERAVREPRRSALGTLHVAFGVEAFGMTDLPPLAAMTDAELTGFRGMLERGVNAPWTSSVGRLFDATSSLLGLIQVNNFEGQAAMALESLAQGVGDAGAYPMRLVELPPDDPYARAGMPRLDWTGLIAALIQDHRRGVADSVIAARFHESLAAGIVSIARHAGEGIVALSGGCFQNRLLLERAISRLREAGFEPLWHRRIPPNDGGIAIGQAVAVARGLTTLE